MKWIRALDLERWSEVISARTALPELVADLIRASAPEISSFRFPSGDKGQVRGFDGRLEAVGVPPFVPDGASIWEFGVGEGVTKAKKDYAKRVKELSAEERERTTFVFVTLQTWDNPTQKLEDWVNDRIKCKDWKDVRYIDGTTLEHWLDGHPAVAARYARIELDLVPQTGARSTDEFWSEYSHRFAPQLREEVLLCDREKQAEDLLGNLGGNAKRVAMAADSPEEVIAFAVAAIRKARPDVRLFLQARTLIVDTEEAARLLQVKKGLIFLPRGQARQIAGVLAQSGPTLIALGADQPNGGAELLPRPSSRALGKAIETMGLDNDQAYDLARSCGRSVTILSRLRPGGAASTPEWMREARTLLPAFIAGGWDASSTLDQDVLTILIGGGSYFEFETQLLPFRRMQDPPLDQEQSVWKTRAPVDAFVHVGHLIGTIELSRLKAAATAVFSQIEPPPDPEEPFSLKPRGPVQHSSWLRDGLATTLLLIAAFAEQARLTVHGSTPQAYVDDLVRSLPGLSQDYRVIASLNGQLPLLAEAAPGPLLSALEHMLEGEGNAIKPIFNEVHKLLAPWSPHTSLLWALEALAWDPAHLRRVSLLLAKLARIDPGGRLSNRPINSLRAIFLSWAPCTNASLKVRLSVLDEIAKREPKVGWDLLIKLFPRGHDTSSPTSKPRFREAGASEGEVLTWARVWESQNQIVTRALALAEENPSRWCAIVAGLGNFESAIRLHALGLIDAFLSRAPEDARREVWAELRDEMHRHKTFAGAGWAMREDDLAKIEEIVRRHEPADLIEQVKWLFDDWSPDIPGKLDVNQNLADEARRRAIIAILTQGGASQVLTLAERAKLPQFVAQAAVEVATDTELPMELILGALARGNHLDHFAAVVSSVSAGKFLGVWIQQFERTALSEGWSPDKIATLLLRWPDRRDTWNTAGRLGPQVEDIYWRRQMPGLFDADVDDAKHAALQYMKVDRATAALESLGRRIGILPINLIFDLLDASVKELNSHPDRINSMLSYHIQEIFGVLEKMDNVSKIDIAAREYAYLPMLDRPNKELNLHYLMAQRPEFYVSVLCDVFREASEKPTEQKPSREAQNRARAGYQLLRSFKSLPGAKGSDVDLAVLRTWVSEVRRRAAEADRAVIAETYIGHLLAHATDDPDDGAWPHHHVRDLIEELDNDQVERGISVERFNMRGVFTKAMYEGGGQERELAANYLRWSATVLSWPRTSAMLRQIAQSWNWHADEEDVRARQDQLRE